jgi:DNA processing protein
MALGIDGAAHRGALQGGGRTIAVLAGGPERPYPRSHRLLYEQIVDRGCAVSESPPGSEARRWAFVARNRIIAAMAGMTVFVEGGESSGAKHTVEFARDASKLVGAIPGPVTSPMSTGPNAELADAERGEAHVVRDVSDVLDALALDGKAPTLPGFGADPDDGISDLERHVLELLGSGERTPRQLAQALPERDPREISRVLGALELRGRIVRDSTGEYGRIL